MANKNNIFKRFDSVMANADKGKPYAVYCYMRFCENFSKDDIALIEKFRAVYTVKQNNLVSSIQSFSEKEAKVIHKFIDFAQDLPATKFTGLLRRIFGISFKDKQKNETKSYEDIIEEGNIDSYISKRWLEQRKYFSKKSQKSQRKFHNHQIAIIILSAVSVVILSWDPDTVVRNAYNSQLETDSQHKYDSLLPIYESYISKYNANLERQAENRRECESFKKEYDSLLNDYNYQEGAQARQKLDIFRKKYDSLRIEYDLLVANEVKKPDIDVIKSKLDVKSLYHPDIISWNKFICAVLSFIIVVISGIDKLKQHQLEWIKNRRATERLKSEISKYKFGIGSYSEEEEEKKTVDKTKNSDSNSPAPSNDGPAPSNGSPAPSNNGAAPSNDGSASANDDPAPSNDGSTPSNDDPAPANDGAAPANDGKEPAKDGKEKTSSDDKKTIGPSKKARLFVERVENIISDDVDEFFNNKSSLSDFEDKYSEELKRRFGSLNKQLKDMQEQLNKQTNSDGAQGS